MAKLQKDGPEELVYQGKIFEVVKQPMISGDKKMEFEIAQRSPGVRLIIVDDGKMLLTKEYRHELGGYDYRLPGGKVFDTLQEYHKHVDADLLPFALSAAKRECREEVGIVVEELTHFATASSGATVVWDLYYFLVTKFTSSTEGQGLEVGEDIEVTWQSFQQVKELCRTGEFGEDRSAGILFRYFLQNQ